MAVLQACGHEPESVNCLGWKGMQNGEILLRASKDFDLFLTRRCRRNLAAALEDWLFFSISRGLPIPSIGGIELKPPAVIAG